MSEAVAKEECEKYQAMWEQEAYRAHSPGEKLVPHMRTMTGCKADGLTILDLGCGTGRASVLLEEMGFEVTSDGAVSKGGTDAGAHWRHR